MGTPVSLREFGRMLGVSGEAVRKAIKTGRLVHGVLYDERGRPSIDPDIAASEWGRNTDRGVGAAARGQGARLPESSAMPSTVPPAERVDATDLNENRARKEYYQAELARLQVEEKTGMLINATEAAERWAGYIAACKTKLLALPSKARSRLSKLDNDDVAVLDQIVREALQELVA